MHGHAQKLHLPEHARHIELRLITPFCSTTIFRQCVPCRRETDRALQICYLRAYIVCMTPEKHG